jgi:hypothetical protein
LATILGAFGTVHAATLEPGPLRAQTFDLTIRPEFDTPDVLVINQATLINRSSTPFQGRVGFRVPKGAQLSMVCEIGSSGGHECQPYKTEDRGDYLEVWWNASKSISPGVGFPVFVEFYYNPLGSGSKKQFTYDFRPVYPMDSLNVTVTEPKGATNFRLDPAASFSEKAANSLTDWRYSFSNREAAPMTFTVSYDKADNTPSVPREGADDKPSGQGGGASNAGAAPAAPSPGAVGPASNDTSRLALAGLALAALTGSIAYVVSSRGKGKRQGKGR